MPFDYDSVLDSARRTGRLLIVTDAPSQGSFAKTVAADIGRCLFGELTAPATALGSQNWIVPPAELVEAFFPSALRIAEAARELVARPGRRR